MNVPAAITVAVVIIVVLLALMIHYNRLWQQVDTDTHSSRRIHDIFYIGYPSDAALTAIDAEAIPGSAFVVSVNLDANKLGTLGFGTTPSENEVENLTKRLNNGESIETTFTLGTSTQLPIVFTPSSDLSRAYCRFYYNAAKTTSEKIEMRVMTLSDLNQVYQNILTLPEA